MPVTDNIFPQSGDADFAENFATWLGRGNISDFVETGMQFTVDYANETLDISQGKAFLVVDQQTISSTSETRLILDYAITISEKSDITLNADETNNLIYLNANIGTNDSPTIEVETSTGAASDDWMHIGTVDTLNDTYDQVNREPSADFDTLATLDTLSIPVYSDLSNASASEASVVYADGSGAVERGIYVHDGSGYISSGVREINNLNDVTGVESLVSDSDANQPAAGTTGRLYIDETNNRIERDTGSSWVTIGTNPSNIGAGDLGFNPATQIELDDHTALVDVHHNRPAAGSGLTDSNNTFNFNPNEVSGIGVESDGSGNIRVDEDFDFTFTSTIDFSAGFDTQGDMTDGTQVIWDASAQEIPDSAMGSIDNSTLSSSSITINSGNQLTGGGSVSLGGSTTLNVDETNLNADTVDGANAEDLSPVYSDGTTSCYIVGSMQFGAEGSSTTSTTYTTIAGSDITFNPDDWDDSNGDLFIRIFGHLKHSDTEGTAYCRLYRQNAATTVSGTEISVTKNNDWGADDSGWVSLTDTGYDSYQLQLRSGDGQSVRYNSVTLYFGVQV